MNTSQQRSRGTKKATSILGCPGRGHSRPREQSCPSARHGRATAGVLGSVLGLLCRRDLDKVWRCHQRTTWMLKGLQHLSCEESRREPGCSAWRGGDCNFFLVIADGGQFSLKVTRRASLPPIFIYFFFFSQRENCISE